MKPQIYFSSDNGRIVLLYTLPKTTTAEKSPEEQRQKTEVFNNPCSLENPETHLDSIY